MAGDIIILLIGSTGSGKTSFVKYAGGIGVDLSRMFRGSPSAIRVETDMLKLPLCAKSTE
jgi:energy-coupling factor transporter ATP-binding protein EcfA2